MGMRQPGKFPIEKEGCGSDSGSHVYLGEEQGENRTCWDSAAVVKIQHKSLRCCQSN